MEPMHKGSKRICIFLSVFISALLKIFGSMDEYLTGGRSALYGTGVAVLMIYYKRRHPPHASL